MNKFNIYGILSVSILILFLCSCQTTEDVDASQPATSRFLVSQPTRYSIEMTRNGSTSPKEVTFSDNSIDASVIEEKWAEVPTRVTGDDVEWDKRYPYASIYIKSNTDNNIVYDVPLNPYNYNVYDKYDVGGNGTIKGTITSSDFFWDTNIWGTDIFKDQELSFYGYYPRPRETFEETNSSYLYERNSVIDFNEARKRDETWNKLNYEFYTQSDANLDHFDLMCSFPEYSNADNSGRYGNKDKKRSDNIQMPFEHVFSLLNIEIRKGDKYENTCNITKLSIRGTQVFKSGTLDLLTGKIEQNDGGGTVIREITSQNITSENPFNTTMILQPSTDEPTAESRGRIIVTCIIDGNKYECDLSRVKLEGGHKYKIVLTVNPGGIAVMRIWNGATVKIGENSYATGAEHRIAVPKSETNFTVSVDNSKESYSVIKNGNPVGLSSNNTYTLEENCTYNIVTSPKNWYVTDNRRIHFDGLWNNKYNDNTDIQTESLMTWDDLSGHDNDGELQGFDAGYGWTGKGLSFDGDNDIVMFPGNINNGDYTIEMYIYIPDKQIKSYPRLIAEGKDYACFCLNHVDNSYYRISIYGNGSLNHQVKDPEIMPTGRMCQLDFVYKASPSHQLTIYMTYADNDGKMKQVIKKTRVAANAKSITTASLGRRIEDKERSMIATYYSFIMYDTAFESEQIEQNYNVNKARFGVGTTAQ